MQPAAGTLTDASSRELLEELGRRLGVTSGKVKLELILVDGRIEDGYTHHRLDVRALDCACARHAWNPDCPRHPPATSNLGAG